MNYIKEDLDRYIKELESNVEMSLSVHNTVKAGGRAGVARNIKASTVVVKRIINRLKEISNGVEQHNKD